MESPKTVVFVTIESLQKEMPVEEEAPVVLFPGDDNEKTL